MQPVSPVLSAELPDHWDKDVAEPEIAWFDSSRLGACQVKPLTPILLVAVYWCWMMLRWDDGVTISDQGIVSQIFGKLFKIMSRKYTMPEIIFMVRMASWNFVRVPKACTKFKIVILAGNMISAMHKFQANISNSSRNVCETPPGCWVTFQW